MGHGGIDVHWRESQICLLAEGGEVIEPRIRSAWDRSRGRLVPLVPR